MKKLTLTTMAVLLAATFAGCASAGGAVCTPTYRELLEADKARLKEQAAEIDRIAASNSFMLPGSVMPRRDVLSQLRKKHNDELDVLEERARFFNAKCTRA